MCLFTPRFCVIRETTFSGFYLRIIKYTAAFNFAWHFKCSIVRNQLKQNMCVRSCPNYIHLMASTALVWLEDLGKLFLIEYSAAAELFLQVNLDLLFWNAESRRARHWVTCTHTSEEELLWALVSHKGGREQWMKQTVPLPAMAMASCSRSVPTRPWLSQQPMIKPGHRWSLLLKRQGGCNGEDELFVWSPLSTEESRYRVNKEARHLIYWITWPIL